MHGFVYEFHGKCYGYGVWMVGKFGKGKYGVSGGVIEEIVKLDESVLGLQVSIYLHGFYHLE